MALVANFKDKGKFAKKNEGSKTYALGNNTTFKCHYCGKMGHRKKFCRKMLFDEKNNKGPKKQANATRHKRKISLCSWHAIK
jgi:hypothetical protein